MGWGSGRLSSTAVTSCSGWVAVGSGDAQPASSIIVATGNAKREKESGDTVGLFLALAEDSTAFPQRPELILWAHMGKQ